MNKVLDSILLDGSAVESFYFNYSKKDFRKWILSVLPEIEKCIETKQDNPWHIYNCMDHILHSVEEMNKLSQGFDERTRKILAYVMFLHDIGKPESHIRRFSKLYGREIDSFFNHNKASVKIADRVLSGFGFLKTEIYVMKKLIDMHDIFMFIRLQDDGNPFHYVLDKKYINEQVLILDKVGDGRDLLKQLIMVGRADNLAQNPSMTGAPLKLLEVMSKMVDCK